MQKKIGLLSRAFFEEIHLRLQDKFFYLKFNLILKIIDNDKIAIRNSIFRICGDKTQSW